MLVHACTYILTPLRIEWQIHNPNPDRNHHSNPDPNPNRNPDPNLDPDSNPDPNPNPNPDTNPDTNPDPDPRRYLPSPSRSVVWQASRSCGATDRGCVRLT